MGERFDLSNEFFTSLVKTRYNFDWMAKDIVEGVVNIQRYRNTIIWAGVHNIHQLDLQEIEADLRGLINVIVPRNRKALIDVSTLIPKPRENHLAVDRFGRYNEAVIVLLLQYLE